MVGTTKRLLLVLFVGMPLALQARGIPDVECKKYWRKNHITNTLPTPGMSWEDYAKYYDRIGRGNCYKQWTAIIYMAADNDLSPFAWHDLWAMESIGSAVSDDVLVFLDNAQVDGMRYLHIANNKDQLGKDGKPLKTLEQFIKEEQLEKVNKYERELSFLQKEGPNLVVSPDAVKPLPEGDSGSLVTASNFIQWALKRYPSRRVLLIGWSHGLGFDAPLPEEQRKKISEELGPLAVPKKGKKGGFALDLNPNNGKDEATYMTVTEMAQGLRQIVENLRGGRPIDIIGSDACLNQQAEFAYEWGPDDVRHKPAVARYVFGSSTIVQKKGFNYHILLDWIKDHPEKPPEELAEEIPELYRRSVSPYFVGERSKFASYVDPFATMATWDTPKLLYVYRALEDLGQVLLDWINENKEESDSRVREFRREIIAKAHRFGGISSDLYNILQVMEAWAEHNIKENNPPEAQWRAILREVKSASSRLGDSVLASYVGDEYLQLGTSAAIKTSKGVAIWLPTTREEAAEMLPRLRQGRFYQREGTTDKPSTWSKFVERLYPAD